MIPLVRFKNTYLILFLSICFGFTSCAQNATEIKVSAEQTELYLNLLKGKNIAVVANQTSVINNTHLIDSLLSLNVGIKKVFAPEHGLTNGSTYRFRGAPTVSNGSAAYGNPASFDGIEGSNIAYASGYAITTGKYVSGSRDTDKTTDYFYFTVNTNTATAGEVKGGKFPVSIGPVTLSA